MLTVVAYGDSITTAAEVPHEKRWLTLAGKRLEAVFPGRRFRMINSGVGGETSREALGRLDTDVLRHEPDVVVIGFGANDATREEERHVSCGEFERNLGTMLAGLHSFCAKALLLNIVPILDEWHSWTPDPYFQENGGLDKCLEPYRIAVRALAAEQGAALAHIDTALRQAIRERGAKTVVMPDGVHLTEMGNMIVAEEVHARLARIFKEEF